MIKTLKIFLVFVVVFACNQDDSVVYLKKKSQYLKKISNLNIIKLHNAEVGFPSVNNVQKKNIYNKEQAFLAYNKKYNITIDTYSKGIVAIRKNLITDLGRKFKNNSDMMDFLFFNYKNNNLKKSDVRVIEYNQKLILNENAINFQALKTKQGKKIIVGFNQTGVFRTSAGLYFSRDDNIFIVIRVHYQVKYLKENQAEALSDSERERVLLNIDIK